MSNDFSRVVIMANQVDRLGGVGRFVERMAVELFENGFDVELLGVNLAPENERVSVRRVEEIHVDSLWRAEAPENWSLRRRRDKLNPLRVRRNKLRGTLRAAGVARLSEKLQTWGPETVIICTQVFAMEHLWQAGYDPLNPRMPRVIGQYHGSYSMCVQTRDIRRVIRNYAEVEKFVCLTESDASKFRSAGLNNVGWIPNPVLRPVVNNDISKQNVFVALGRYDAQKSLDYIIRAWSRIEDKLPDWRVELYGEGPLEAKLQELISSLGVNRLSLMGKTDEVAEVLSLSKVHLLSSQYEGLPIAIVEASLAGVPTIAFDCAPGIRDLIIPDISGYVVKQNDVIELSERMYSLANLPETLESFSVAGMEHSQQYLPENVIEIWKDLFKELSN
ncbi:glycosyltransferase [Glutamicibacter arilaitensis]|uniref:Glycosyl transferase family 1 domain-containing protein n=1 Tax=Glutamicibacter arilaitensis TaxID=256701 RepID=A0A2N7S4S2_9MICC|nr:glycosyltransferase [Glutamicibacter arilaitensis]PMQ21124.1 hypothetical protein CIK84_06000 [Glutamicibacter arilaitensis]